MSARRPVRPVVARAHEVPAHPEPELLHSDPTTVPAGDFTATAVANASLRREMVPSAGAPWEAVEEFALSYDGYAYWSDVAELASRALRRWTRDGTLPTGLDELRGCLFYEQRRWHHFGYEPYGRAAEYAGALLEAIAQNQSRPVVAQAG